MKLLVATRNRNKLEEIVQIFKMDNLELVTVDDIDGLPDDVEEDAETFAGNALKKARTLCDASGLWTISDDSGLEVDALDNAPGVHSARYAGEDCDHAANNAKLLRELEGIKNRAARFRCVIALCSPDGRDWSVSGSCEGSIPHSQQGTNGFGYDPLFQPNGYHQSFAELDSSVKNKISHRGNALKKAAELWNEISNSKYDKE